LDEISAPKFPLLKESNKNQIISHLVKVKYIQLYIEFFDLKIMGEAIVNVASFITEIPLLSQIYHVVSMYFWGRDG
jgi:hypothetical protein